MGFIFLIAMCGIVIGSIFIFIGLACLKQFFNPDSILTPFFKFFLGIMGVLIIIIGFYLLVPCFNFINHLF